MKSQRTIGVIKEIFFRNRFFQANIFSGTTKTAESWRALKGIFKKTDNASSIQSYERAFAEYLGVSECFSFSAGRMALYAILKTLGIGSGDEVIIPAFTCVVVANAIIYTGAKPIYCDIELERFGPNPASIETKITDRTKAIIAQHTFGIPCLIDQIIELGKKYNIPLIEDCAHSLGGEDKKRMLGTIGCASFFSTDHTKVISTGIGGVATSGNNEFLKKLSAVYREAEFLSTGQVKRQILTYAFFHCLTHPRIYWLSKYFLSFLIKSKIALFITDYLNLQKPTSYPFPARLSGVHAEIGLSQLQRLANNLAERQKAVSLFEDQLGANAKLFQNKNIKCGWLRYPILITNREEFLKDIYKYYDCGIWFTTVTLCRQSNFHEIGYQEGSCPIAERATKQIVSLPTHTRFKPLKPLLAALAELKKNDDNTFTYVRSR